MDCSSHFYYRSFGCAVLLQLLLFVFPSNYCFTEYAKSHMSRIEYYTKGIRVEPELRHHVTFALKQRNMDVLEEILFNVSDPNSLMYGKYLSSAQVAAISANTEASANLLDYLKKNRITVIHRTLYDEFVTAAAPIRIWEQIFSTKFVYFHHVDNRSSAVAMAMKYTLSDEISGHIESVFNVIHLPLPQSSISPIFVASQGAAAATVANPAVLNNYYNIFTNAGSTAATQSIFSAIGQYFSSEDLAAFQSYFGIPNDPVDADPNNRNNHAQCVAKAAACSESNLDLQYIMSVARGSFTKIIYATDFLQWIVGTASETKPALVHSISYGGQESTMKTGYGTYVNLFNQQAIKLGTMGVTVVVSSGDDGASGNLARGVVSKCRYDPAYPASSPYVTAVGATQGPESSKPEVACSWSTGGVITSGGGFSTLQSAQSYQTAAIAGYFQRVSEQPVSGYNSNGRGFPDVSIMGYNFPVLIAGKWSYLCGTSASAPVFAGMVTLVNAARIRAGQPTVGFLNPTLYASGGSFANDITSGDNKCNIGVCCSQGFRTASGWDPVTGFGSVDFRKFFNLFMGISPTATPSASPSAIPSTSSPTSPPTSQPVDTPSASHSVDTPPSHATPLPSDSPTAEPTAQPSVVPTLQPSTLPSGAPTAVPSSAPTAVPSDEPTTEAPSVLPSGVPTVIPSSAPTVDPSSQPTIIPTQPPSIMPSHRPSMTPSQTPSMTPSQIPSMTPSMTPSQTPSVAPSMSPTTRPTRSGAPSAKPSRNPTRAPSSPPSRQPGRVTAPPTMLPSLTPSRSPSVTPSSRRPSRRPTARPSVVPTSRPTSPPTRTPSSRPSTRPSTSSSKPPSWKPSGQPRVTTPSRRPSPLPTKASTITASQLPN